MAFNFVRVVLFAAVALLPALARAQAIEAWVQRYNGPGGGDDMTRGMAVDPVGNVYVTGTSVGSSGYREFATIKYSSAGVPLWTNRYSGSVGWDADAGAVAVDSSGDVFVTGLCNGTSGDASLTIKYSSAGVALWTNRYSPASGGIDVVVDGSGNVVVSGSSDAGGRTTAKYSGAGALLWARDYKITIRHAGQALLAVDSSDNVLVTGDWEEAYVTLKYSSAGALLWTNRYKGPGTNYHRDTSVAVDASDNVIVTGHSASMNDYPYDFDFATIKYSSAGVPLWTNRYGGPGGGDDGASAVAVDANGNVIVTGFSETGAGYDYATVKYSSAGVPLWTNLYNGPGNGFDEPCAVAVEAGGNVYVTGSSGGDYATVAYSSAGVPLWTNRYDGPAGYEDSPTAVAVDANGNIYVTGRSANTNSWPNGYDYATVKYVVPPILTLHPLSRTNAVGSTATFAVATAGSAPFSYQWRRHETNLVDGGNISGVTTTNLLIANVQLSDAAGYAVVVTNAYGSVTSSVAQLTVVVPPNPGRFSNLSYSPVMGFSFIFRDATLGQPYRIQRSPSMAEGSWVDWQSFTYTEPIALTDLGATGAERRFYRAVSP